MSRSLTSNLFSWLLFLVVLLFGITSCNKTSKTNAPLEIYEYKDSVVIEASPDKINLQKAFKGKAHLCLGKILNYEGKDRVEKNLLSQIATHNSALMHGDKQNCVKYLYKDAIAYFHKYYPGLSDEAITDEFFKDLSQSYVEKLNKFSEHGIDISLVIPNLKRKIMQGNNVFIVFNLTFNVCSENLYTHFSDYEQILGISHNGGKNWCYITINEDTPNILRISNSEDIIDAVMGY